MSAPLSPEAMAAIQAPNALGLYSLRADAPQTLSEWAAEHFLLAGESSHQKGGWVGWPFQLGILDFMSDDRIEELAVKKSKRVGYTKLITAFVAYNIAHRRRKISHGIKLWLVGVDSAKDLLLGQLAIDKPGPGYVHTSQKLPREWYEQLTAEQRVLVKVNGKDVYRWVKRRPRNEVLDCRNYALHAAMCLGIHKWPEARWLQLEQTVQPPQDLFNTAPAQTAQPQPQSGEAAPPRAPARPSPSRQLADEELFSPISLY